MTTESILRALAATLIGFGLQMGVVILAVLIVRRFTHPDAYRHGIERLRRLPWQEFDAPLMVAVMLGVQLLALPLAAPALERWRPDLSSDPLLDLAIRITLTPLAILALFWLLARRRGIGREALWGDPPRALWRPAAWGLLHYLAALPLVALGAAFWAFWLHQTGYTIDRQPVLDLLMRTDGSARLRVYTLFLAVTLMPLAEECVFRGVLLPLALRQTRRPAIAIMGVSLIFAGLHLHVPSLAPLFVLSCAFSLAHLQTGSLLTPVVMHALFNGISLMLLMLLHQ